MAKGQRTNHHPARLQEMQQVEWYSELALQLLEDLETRVRHVIAVADVAQIVAKALFDNEEDAKTLVIAAWVHDIGYASDLAVTGFHHLDGARHLESIGEHRLACLVAHHSSGTEEAGVRGMQEDLAPFPFEPGLFSDCLTYCDLSTGPSGERVGLEDRIAEVAKRYGEDAIVPRGLRLAYPRLRASFDVVESYLGA